MIWSAKPQAAFADERTRPMRDLLGAVACDAEAGRDRSASRQ